MDSESAMTAALIDPQLEPMVQDNSAEGMQYHYPLSTSTALEPWNSMFESIGELPQRAQVIGMIGSDLRSDETSSVSFSLSTEQDMQFPLSPLEGSANLGESPGGTSVSMGLSEAGTNTKQKTPKAKQVKQAKKARRRHSETEKKEQIKHRNRVAASKCRQKKNAKVDELKETMSSLEARNNELHIEYQRLRQEIGRVKSDLIHHTECNDPNINQWVENEAKGYVEKLHNNEWRRMGSIRSADGVADAMHMSSLHEAAMPSKDPYMGLG